MDTQLCERCGRERLLQQGLCFACRCKTVSFTYNGAHRGRAGWNESTVETEKREIYEAARRTGTDITRAP